MILHLHKGILGLIETTDMVKHRLFGKIIFDEIISSKLRLDFSLGCLDGQLKR